MKKISDEFKIKIVTSCFIKYLKSIEEYKDIDTIYMNEIVYYILSKDICYNHDIIDIIGIRKNIPVIIDNDIENFGYSTPNKRRLQKLKHLYE